MSEITSPHGVDDSVAEDIAAVRESVRRFIDAEIAPHYADWERVGHVPRDLWRKMGAAGFLCAAIPEQYGGGGAYMRVALAIIAEFTRSLYALPGFYTHSEIIVPYILHYGTEAQKQYWLPRCASGETVTSIAMTEPDAGSDLKGTRTAARRDGEEFVIDGQKTFITNGFHADLVIVLATTQDAAGKPESHSSWSKRSARDSAADVSSTRSANARRTPPNCSSKAFGFQPTTCWASLARDYLT